MAAAPNYNDKTKFNYDISTLYDEKEDENKNESDSDDSNGPLIQLHVWDWRYSSWIPLKKALKTKSQKKIQNKSKLMTSKKYGGLDPNEIVIYQSIEKICETVHELVIPHDLLMMILIYSQGYKFDPKDNVICFPGGIFNDSAHCKVEDIIEDDKKGQMYKMRRLTQYGVRSEKTVGGAVRVPFHHTFANKLVIIDDEEFSMKYPQYKKKNIKYGHVLEIFRLYVVHEDVYSRKKKRNIKKSKVMVKCASLEDTNNKIAPTHNYPYHTVPMDVQYDSSIFVQAKWKKIDR